jgi:hypothetical protein
MTIMMNKIAREYSRNNELLDLYFVRSTTLAAAANIAGPSQEMSQRA